MLGAEPANSAMRRMVRVGERAPLTNGCSGTSILAYLPEPEAREIIKVHTKPAKRSSVASQLDRIRHDGYAVSFSANHAGLNGISAALLDPEDALPLASIAIAGADRQLPATRLRKLAGPLRAAASDLAPKLAVVLGPNSSMRTESLNVTIQDFLET